MSVPLASLFLFLLLGGACPALMAQGRFRIVEYNCENLFDTVHDAGKDDVAFLPSAPRKWNGRKFWQKLNNLSKAIVACGEGMLPDVVALCEIENDSCLHALTRRSPLRRAGYDYVMADSPDRRGIDVAFLYQPGAFRLLSNHSYRIPQHLNGDTRPTRDILHVTGMVRTLDTLDVFVCHMPSRLGSERFRLYAASILKEKVDSVTAVRKHPMIIIAGDFNDEPENLSLRHLSKDFIVLTNKVKGKFHPHEVEGTYYYKGIWHRFDHFLVNKTWYEKRSGFRPADSGQAHILDFPFLLEEDQTFSRKRPYAFLKGYRYNGGYSDHLPVSIDFLYE